VALGLTLFRGALVVVGGVEVGHLPLLGGGDGGKDTGGGARGVLHLTVGLCWYVGISDRITSVGGGVPRDVEVPLPIRQGGALGAMAECVLDVLVVVHYWMDVVEGRAKRQPLPLGHRFKGLLFAPIKFFPAERVDKHGVFFEILF